MMSDAKTSDSAARVVPKVRRQTSAAFWPVPQPSSEHNSAPCACGGSCPRCDASPQLQRKLAIGAVDDPLEREADQVADEVMRMPAGQGTPRLQRKSAGASDTTNEVPGIVEDVLRSPGEPLSGETRAFMEPRFGGDFGDVRVHTDAKATQSARAVGALAYAVGRDIVFDREQYSPGTVTGDRLLAHEIAHVEQQRHGAPAVQRTPASKVSCANAVPLHIPGPPAVDIADPVGVITAAEDRANQMLDDVVATLDATRQRIIGGEPAAWPTISDAIGEGLRLMGLDPDDAAIWTAPAGTGTRSVPLLLRRLRLVRGTIGAGSFFFVCLGTGRRTLGPCAAAAGDLCATAVATTCAGHFITAFCPDFWTNSAEDRAARIVHESAHNFADFIGHAGRFTNAECFARLVQVFAGVPESDQRVDLCPNP